MDELKIIKNYLRIDDDITEDDEQLQALILAAHDYITNSTGKQYDETEPVMQLATKLLVNHWYNDRTLVSKGTVTEYSHGLSAIMTHIETSDNYKEVSK